MSKRSKVSKSHTMADAKKSSSQNGSSRSIHFVSALIALCLGIVTPPLISTLNPELGERFVGTISRVRNLFAFIKLDRKTVGHWANDVVDTAEQGLEDAKKYAKSSQFVECNTTNLNSFLYKEEGNPGVHIFCFNPDESLLVYRDSHVPTTIRRTTKNLPLQTLLDDIIYGELMIEPHTQSNTQPFAFFSSNGERILEETALSDSSIPLLAEHGMVLLFQGGNWVWPGIRIGFKRQIEVATGYKHSSSHDHNQSVTLEIETLSMKPLVLSVQNFIAETECDHIQRIAEPDMEYSSVSLMDKDKGRPASDFRTSQSAFLEAQDEIMHALEERTASLTRIPKNHQEHTQVLRYGYSEKYSAHLDWFDPELYQNDAQTQRMIDHGKRNRLATVFWYLSDVEEGGHTVFPRFNGAPQPYDFDDCTKRLKVKPEKGKVIIFYSLLPNGQGDPLSLHGACPVKKGIKWAANKWVWNAKMFFVS